MTESNRTMCVMRLHGPGDMRLHHESIPVPGPGESLVRVTAVGVCGSDLHWFSEAGIGDARLARPLVLGHEFAGVTEEGRRVAVDPAIACGRCEYCQAGHPNFCLELRFAGHGENDGALREYIAWPTHCLYPLPDSLTDADGAMLEPLGVAIHAVDLAHIKPGMTVSVFGCGPIGLLTLQVARAAGATQLYATDLPGVPHRLEAARSFGAKVFAADSHQAEAREILAMTGKQGVDVAFEAAGDNEAVEAAIATVKPGGKVILVGIPSDDRTAFTASIARRKGLTIKLVRRMKLTYPRAIRLVESGQVDVRSLVTHHLSLQETAQAFAIAARRQGIKIVVGDRLI
jgi:L-iditol 2-dehydrogenase